MDDPFDPLIEEKWTDDRLKLLEVATYHKVTEEELYRTIANMVGENVPYIEFARNGYIMTPRMIDSVESQFQSVKLVVESRGVKHHSYMNIFTIVFVILMFLYIFSKV